MTQNSFYADHNNIELEVSLKSGESYKGLKCFLLRTYSEQYDTCDAHALIYCYEINGVKVEGKRIEPDNYSTFCDNEGRVWHVDGFKENSPPEAPGFIFRLKKHI